MPNYVDNLSQRTPCLLILDASSSMAGRDSNGQCPIDLLNEGIVTLRNELATDDVALSRVQIAAVNVGGFSDQPELFLDWTDAVDFQPFAMKAGFNTPLGAGVLVGLDAIEQQKATLRSSGINYTRPWLFILTDGAPTDADSVWRDACARARDYEARGKVQIYPIGVGNVDLRKLAEISTTKPILMSGLKFRELFTWISGSLQAASNSAPGARIDLPSTDPWASVKL